MSSTLRSGLARSRGAAIGAQVTLLPVGCLYVLSSALGSQGAAPTIDELARSMGRSLEGLPVVLALILAGATVGWIWAPRANPRGRRGAVKLVVELALTATFLGAVAVAALLPVLSGYTITATGGLLPAWMAGFMLFLGAGLLWFGLPSLILTIPTAYLWHRLARDAPSPKDQGMPSSADLGSRLNGPPTRSGPMG